MYPAWEVYLPGFRWISWGSFFLGLGESFIYGLLLGALFVPLYHFFSRKIGKEEGMAHMAM